MAWWNRVLGGGTSSGEAGPRHKKRVKVQAAEQLQREGAVPLDVREQNEWAAGRAPEARHIPLGQLGTRARSSDGFRIGTSVPTQPVRRRDGAPLAA